MWVHRAHAAQRCKHASAATDHPPTTEWHKVQIANDSVLEQIYGPSKAVNSLHHQAIDQLAPTYRATAIADDGGVEGIEHTKLPLVAVQWHPEMMPTAATDPIFAWLIEAAASRASN